MNTSEQMRSLINLFESENFSNGVYMCANVSQETKDALRSLCAAYDVPDYLPANEMHCTIIYSEKPDPNFACEETYSKPLEAKFAGYDLFGEDKDTLVILLDSPDLQKRHKELMDQYDLTYTWDDYKPHVSLSYNAKDFDISKLDPYHGPLLFAGETASNLEK